jgi:pimeloyl-ACP methyl ester carboxylesterase
MATEAIFGALPHVDLNRKQLFYEEAGAGPAVVLLHEGLMDRRMWEPQWPAFTKRFRTIRFDAPGFGLSEPAAENYVLADVLGGLLDLLGIDNAALVGASMGGKAAIDYALQRPDRVSALVAAAPGLSGFSFQAYSDEQDARGEALWEARDLIGLADLWLEAWASNGADETLRTIAHDCAKTFELPEEVNPPLPAADRLSELGAPTLVISGGRDVQGINDICALLAREVPGARLEVFEDSDHLPMYREPERFNALVLEFLESATPGFGAGG